MPLLYESDTDLYSRVQWNEATETEWTSDLREYSNG